MATAYAKHMVLEWGMSSRLGFIRYSSDDGNESLIPEKEYSPETARIIDEEIKQIIDAAYTDAERMVTERWDTVASIAEALLKYETLQSNEVETLMAGGTINRPTVTDLLDAESDASPPASDSQSPTDKKTSVNDADDGLLPAPA